VAAAAAAAAASAGSLLYMAPEVFRQEPYSEKVRRGIAQLGRLIGCTTHNLLAFDSSGTFSERELMGHAAHVHRDGTACNTTLPEIASW
jgi:hypothetical protein